MKTYLLTLKDLKFENSYSILIDQIENFLIVKMQKIIKQNDLL